MSWNLFARSGVLRRGLRGGLAGLCLATLALTGCSDGGGGDPPPPAETAKVTAVTAGSPKYGQTLLFTVDGSLLDGTLTVAASACTNLQRSTTAPNVSSATRAFYTCTLATTGASTFSVAHPTLGALGSLNFTVPQPQVTLTVANGAGVAGDLVFTLDPAKVKLTVDNFLRYVNDGFYVGTVFHRVMTGFVAQGGGYVPVSGTLQLKTTRAPIALQVGQGLSNTALTLAMARGAAADTATAQFFVNLGDNSGGFDPSNATPGYAVFGVLSTGQAVLNSIVAAPCAPVSGFSECQPGPFIVITAAAQTR